MYYEDYEYDVEPSEADDLLEEFKKKAWELIKPDVQNVLVKRNEEISGLKNKLANANKTISELKSDLRDKTLAYEQQEKKYTKDLMKNLEEYCGRTYYFTKRNFLNNDVTTVVSDNPVTENDNYFVETATTISNDFVSIEEIKLISVLGDLFIRENGDVFGSVKTEDYDGYSERKKVEVVEYYTSETREKDVWRTQIVFTNKEEAQKYADKLTKEMQKPVTTYQLVYKEPNQM